MCLQVFSTGPSQTLNFYFPLISPSRSLLIFNSNFHWEWKTFHDEVRQKSLFSLKRTHNKLLLLFSKKYKWEVKERGKREPFEHLLDRLLDKYFTVRTVAAKLLQQLNVRIIGVDSTCIFIKVFYDV